MQRCLAVELASTVHHERDGAGTEQLASPRQTAQWLRSCGDLPTDLGPTPLEEVLADEHTRAELVQLRDAIRTLFARLVDPEAPGAEDPHPSPGEYGGKDGEDGQVGETGEHDEPGGRREADKAAARAVAHLNAVAAREFVAPQLEWDLEGPPSVRLLSEGRQPADRLLPVLARATIDFLNSPLRTRLRACTAPRCSRYFLKSHGRQEWCNPSCANRARAARHYRRQHGGGESPR